MKNVLLVLLLFTLFLPSKDVAAAPSLQTATAAEVINAINTTRFLNGRYPYAINTTLMAIAQSHSIYQASISEMTLTGANGGRVSDRAASVGYGAGAVIHVNEMVYAGRSATAVAALEFWISSEIISPILLSGEFHEFGVGVATDGTTTYITVNVGSIEGVTNALPLGQSTPITTGSTVEDIPTTTPPIDGSDTGAIIENQPDLGSSETNSGESEIPPNARSNSAPDQVVPQLGLLQNPALLWTIIIMQLLAMGGLGYLIWIIRRNGVDRAQGGKKHKTMAGTIPFQELSYKEQFRRLEILARRALENYDLEVIRLTPLQYRLNAAFKVEAVAKDEPGADPQKYLLRINSPIFQSETNIRSEMQWLNAIHRDTKLVAPNPLKTTERTLLTTVEVDGVPERRHAVVLHWVEGKSPFDNLTPDILTKLGAYAGKLHKHAIEYNPPVGFERKHWNLAGFAGEMLDVPVTKARRSLSAKQLAIIEKATKKIEKVTDQLGGDPEVFGLIHAELHENNYLIMDGEVRVIDFDTCGWGYFLYELAVTLSTIIARPHYPALKDALLNGYRQERTLTREQELMLVPFIAARFMTNIFWLAGHVDESAFAVDAPRLINRNIEFLEQFARNN